MEKNKEKLHYIALEAEGPRPSEGHPLLLLHGYGSEEYDLAGLAPHLDRRFLVISVRAPQELEWGGFSWFPLEMGPSGVQFQYEQALSAREKILALLEKVRSVYPVDPERIFLLGFSQGATMAVSAALERPAEVAGVVCLSGFLIREVLPQGDGEVLRGLPMLMTHGTRDPVVSIEQGRQSRQLIESLPLELDYREYDMGHEIGADCFEDLKRWLDLRLKSAKG